MPTTTDFESDGYTMDRPLPTDVVVSRAARVLRYQQYPVFSWPWLRGRSLFALVLISVLVLFTAVRTGLLAASVTPALLVAGYQFLAFVLMATVGPLLGTLVRHRHMSRRREGTALVVAVLAGMAVGGAVDHWASNQVMDLVRHNPALPDPPRPELSGTVGTLFTALGFIVMTIGYALFGGGWALRAWFTERRRWLETRRRRQISELRQQKQQADLRLSALEAQIEPHFLFNTLASVRALIRSDAIAAEAMLDAMTAYLRGSIPQVRGDGVPTQATLGQQVGLCGKYLELMRLRLSGRLDYAVDVDSSLRALSYPPLLLMTLVENAIQHGIEPSAGPGRVEVTARLDGETLEVAVRDNGAGLAAGMGAGVGLANIRKQLATRFGERASLELGTRAGWTEAIVRTPREPADD